MKTLKRIIPILTFIAVAATGCAGGLLTPQTTTTQQVTAQPVTNQVVTVTNVVTEVHGVNVTNQVFETNTVVSTVMHTNEVTVTNSFTPNGTVSTVLSGLQTANTLTGPFDPFSGSVAAVLGLAVAGLSWFAKVKTTQAQTHASAAATVITAIEGLADPMAAAVKVAVAAKSAQMGTSAEVNAVVNAVTSKL